MKAIRFPSMSQKEFVSVVFDSRILNFQELSELMKYYSDVELTYPLTFLPTPTAHSMCHRFSEYQSPAASWPFDFIPPGKII